MILSKCIFVFGVRTLLITDKKFAQIQIQSNDN